MDRVLAIEDDLVRRDARSVLALHLWENAGAVWVQPHEWPTRYARGRRAIESLVPQHQDTSLFETVTEVLGSDLDPKSLVE